MRHLSTRLWTQQKIPAADVNARKENIALNSAGLGSKELARDTVLRLRNAVQIYELEHGRVVGEEQMCNCLSSQASVQLCVPYGLKEVHESRSSVSRL